MSIIRNTRNKGRRAHDYVNAAIVSTLYHERKRDLRAMLTEVVRNTAALPIESQPEARVKHPHSAASATEPTPVPVADAFIPEGR